MKEITKRMINVYNIKNFDFMGYKIYRPEELSYHHNIIARRNGGPETIRNGAILVQHTSHNYLHTIERYDKEIFYRIASEMLDENIKGCLDIYNLRKKHKLTLESLCYRNGLEPSTLSRIEKGIVEPKYLTLLKIAEAFSLKIDELLKF